MNEKGFTLTELMMVILIIAILAAFAIPLYNNAIDNQNNARAKAYLETINAGLERFHQEYHNVTISVPAGSTNFILNPGNTTCSYRGQQIASTTTSTTLSLSNFITQMIVCGYIPRYNYGDSSVLEDDGSLDYRFRLQNPNDNPTCGHGYVYMEPKISSTNTYSVGNKYCRPIDNSTVCRYCAGIDLTGKAQDYMKN